MAVSMYLYPLVHFNSLSTKTRSADHILSILITITRRQEKLRLIGLCSSSANFTCQLEGFSRFMYQD